jgi:hypothetical protein
MKLNGIGIMLFGLLMCFLWGAYPGALIVMFSGLGITCGVPQAALGRMYKKKRKRSGGITIRLR